MDRFLPLLLPVLGTLWVSGWIRRGARKSIWRSGNLIVGTVGLFAAVTWLWKNRKDAISVVAATVLGVSVLVLVGAWCLVPEWRLTITAPILVAGLCAYIYWDWRHTQWAPLAAVLGLKQEEIRVRRAVTDTHDNARPRAAHKTGERWTIDVDHTGPVDPQLVGQRLQSGGAALVPTDRLGRSKIVLDDKYLGEWEPFRRTVGWDGPVAREAGDDLVFGFDAQGGPVSVPWPGWGGRHVLVTGATGAGKSVLLRVLIAEMAYCPNVDLVLCDPKQVEFRAWGERAHVATGPEASGKAFDAVVTEMMRRYETLPDDEVEWSHENGPWIVLVVDEIASLKRVGTTKERSKREDDIELIASMGRAAGIGMVIATQRASADKALSTDIRDNCRTRIGLGSESLIATKMGMGDDVDDCPCHLIPESLTGALYRRLDRRSVKARTKYLGPKEPRRIAAETAKNKGDAAWLKV